MALLMCRGTTARAAVSAFASGSASDPRTETRVRYSNNTNDIIVASKREVGREKRSMMMMMTTTGRR